MKKKAHAAKGTGKKPVKKQQRKMKPKRQPPSKKLGQAATLPGSEWGSWLCHIMRFGTTWLYVVVLLTHLLCLRITEALRLRAENFRFKTPGTVYVAPLKNQPGMTKPLLAGVHNILEHLRKQGVKQKRKRNCGGRGHVTYVDKWEWPSKGLLFPASRSDCKSAAHNKDSVSKAIARLRQTFVCHTQQTVRSHSGRHTMINLLKHAGLPDTVAKFYARIKDQKTFESYGMCTETQATKTLQTSKAVQRLFADAYSKAPRVCVTKKSKATKTKVQQTTANKSIKGKRLLADPKHGSKK